MEKIEKLNNVSLELITGGFDPSDHDGVGGPIQDPIQYPDFGFQVDLR